MCKIKFIQVTWDIIAANIQKFGNKNMNANLPSVAYSTHENYLL